jgi:hypothetical protein
MNDPSPLEPDPPTAHSADPPMTATFIRVLVVQALVLTGLWLLQTWFSH